jgi:hypothetical protein
MTGNEYDWDKELKPDMKYYRGWHLIALIILMKNSLLIYI